MRSSGRSVVPLASLLLALTAVAEPVGRRALQSAEPVTSCAHCTSSIWQLVAACLAEDAAGDCPNNPHGHIRDWVTSGVEDMRGREPSAPRSVHMCVLQSDG